MISIIAYIMNKVYPHIKTRIKIQTYKIIKPLFILYREVIGNCSHIVYKEDDMHRIYMDSRCKQRCSYSFAIMLRFLWYYLLVSIIFHDVTLQARLLRN